MAIYEIAFYGIHTHSDKRQMRREQEKSQNFLDVYVSEQPLFPH